MNKIWWGIPARLRTVALIAILLALQLWAAGTVETLRILGLRWLVTPLTGIESDGLAHLDAPPPAVDDRLAVLEVEVRAPYDVFGGPLLPILDHDADAGWLLVGGGARAGIRRGALAVVPDGCVGVVDRVLENLARVRLLSAAGTRLPVQAGESRVELPGALDRLRAIAEGDGERVFLARAHLPQGFQLDDELRTPPPGPDRPGWLVGRVTRPGARPEVELAARPEASPLVSIEGADVEIPREDLFERMRFELLARGRGPHPTALLGGDGAGQLLPGSAVQSSGRYLGRVTRVAPGVAQAVPLRERRNLLRVRVAPPDAPSQRALLRWSRGDRFRVDSWVDGTPAEDGPVLLVTAGGDALIPPGLVVGQGVLDAEEIGLETEDVWPRMVEVAVFRHGDERRHLLRGRR